MMPDGEYIANNPNAGMVFHYKYDGYKKIDYTIMVILAENDNVEYVWVNKLLTLKKAMGKISWHKGTKETSETWWDWVSIEDNDEVRAEWILLQDDRTPDWVL